MSTEKYTMQRTVCTCHFALLSKQNWNTAFCLIATSVLFFSSSLNTTCHLTAKQMTCWWGSVLLSVPCWFLSVKREIRFGRQLRCGSYHNLSLILLAAVQLNGQHKHTSCSPDWRKESPPIPSLPYSPSSSPPSHPHELPRWQVINPFRHWVCGVSEGGWRKLGREGDEDGGGGSRGGVIGSCNTNLKEISPHA